MNSPPHPGKGVRALCIEPAGLTVAAAAGMLDVSRKTLSELLNRHSGVSLAIAVRLSKGFGGSIESWLIQQMPYDLAQIQSKTREINVHRYEPL